MTKGTLSFVLAALAATAALGQNLDNVLGELKARSLGPTRMGGRIADIAVFEKEPRIFYVATAAGGLWKTTNGGMTMQAVWDRGTSISLGAVDVSQKDPNLVWIGTGEQNSRNSVSWGDGAYKSTDGGKTWQDMGLKATRHISQVIVDPKDNDTVYVAALGKLWGTNEERGVFKTTDGGKTWQHVLKIDEKTGVVDMVMDPSNNRVLFAAAYQRIRLPWNYISGGPGSALYKSSDAGKTWRKISKGMPEGTYGRIGIDIHRNDPRKMIMQIEASTPNADPTLAPTPTGGVFYSEDRGESWTKMSSRSYRYFYFTIPRYDPNNENRIYTPDVQIFVSDDKGKTMRNFPTSVHVDHHAMWINPNDSNHILIGEDGGVGQTRDGGATWEHLNYMAIGQFYACSFDMRKPYYVYGGLQDNGSWGGPTQTARGSVAFWDWYGVGGGDGFYTQNDPDDWGVVYSESQGGAAGMVNLRTGERRNLRPARPEGEPPYRFNWNTPIELSPHNPRIVYLGGNKIFRSLDRGAGMTAISPDLTTNDTTKKPGPPSVTWDRTGAENYCTVITISESGAKAGVIWGGTDDGKIWVTQDFGATWSSVAENLPAEVPRNSYVSRVQASKYAAGRCYVTLDNHRIDDISTYVFVTEDFGKTWKKIVNGMRTDEPCHVVREGTQNPDLLLVGTEYGIYVSLDRGENWTKYKEFPTVPVHDIRIHPRELDAVIATHGRSIWTLNISALEELIKANTDKDVFLARPQNVYIMNPRSGQQDNWDGDRIWAARNTQPGTDICYYFKADQTGDVTITVTDVDGNTVGQQLTGYRAAGMHVQRWTPGGGFGGGPGGGQRRRFGPGDYKVTLKVGDKTYTTTIHVENASDQGSE
ncbi:MAG: hypothetical protein HZC36_04935 [Armatimonadetes bacterium]|nr:hypothetical protein [Armatimonadota bacterium]